MAEIIYQIVENGTALNICAKTESQAQKWIVLKAKQFMKDNGVKYKENQERIFYHGEKNTPPRPGIFLFFKNPGPSAHSEYEVCKFSEVAPWFGAKYMKEEEVCYTINYIALKVVSFNEFDDDVYSEEFTRAPQRPISIPRTQEQCKVLTQIKTGNLKQQLRKAPPQPPLIPFFDEEIAQEKITEINKLFINHQDCQCSCHSIK